MKKHDITYNGVPSSMSGFSISASACQLQADEEVEEEEEEDIFVLEEGRKRVTKTAQTY